MIRYAMIADNVLKQKILYLPFMKFLGNLFFWLKKSTLQYRQHVDKVATASSNE